MPAKVKALHLRTPIEPKEFQRLIANFASDIQLRFNPINERWSVWQVQVAPIEVIGQARIEGSLMWTIEEDNGDFRLPMHVDLNRIKKTLANFKLLQKIGPEAYADRLDKRDIAREKMTNPNAERKLREGARELADHLYGKKSTISMHSAGSSK